MHDISRLMAAAYLTVNIRFTIRDMEGLSPGPKWKNFHTKGTVTLYNTASSP